MEQSGCAPIWGIRVSNDLPSSDPSPILLLMSFANEKVSKGSFFTLHEQGLVQVFIFLRQSRTGSVVCLCFIPLKLILLPCVCSGRAGAAAAGGGQRS